MLWPPSSPRADERPGARPPGAVGQGDGRQAELGRRLERLGEHLELAQAVLPLAVRGRPVDAVRLVIAGDRAPVQDMDSTGAPGIGELPVSRLPEVVHSGDANPLVVGIPAPAGPLLLCPV